MSSCQNRCYEIGGPWITFDPECPVHGYEAQRREVEHDEMTRATEAEKIDMLNRIKTLEQRVTYLENANRRLRSQRIR